MSVYQSIQNGVSALGIEATEEQLRKLEQYVNLLVKWNKTYNLTAITDPTEMVTKHLLDALSILKKVEWQDGERILDIGTGGGIPGIPLAIFLPQCQFHLVDKSAKKIRFVQQAIYELGLKHVQGHATRIEHFNVELFSTIVSRAFSKIEPFVNLTKHLIAKDGRWLAMKGVNPLEEIDELGALYCVKINVSLTVPGLDAQRHLVVIQHT